MAERESRHVISRREFLHRGLILGGLVHYPRSASIGELVASGRVAWVSLLPCCRPVARQRQRRQPRFPPPPRRRLLTRRDQSRRKRWSMSFSSRRVIAPQG